MRPELGRDVKLSTASNERLIYRPSEVLWKWISFTHEINSRNRCVVLDLDGDQSIDKPKW